jgi:hypothetical protein
MHLISAPPTHDRCGEVSSHVAHRRSHLFPHKTYIGSHMSDISSIFCFLLLEEIK